MKEFKRIILWTLVFFWMLVIYIFSNQTGDSSGNLSAKVTISILEIFYPKFTSLSIDLQISLIQQLQIFIRKFAHAYEYAMLAFFVVLAFRSICKKKIFYIWSILFCLLCAIGDELHQSFIGGRVASPKDVLIDFSGILVMVIILYIISLPSKRKKRCNL